MTYNPIDPVDVIARTLWGEARGEGRTGMEAVAAVIQNRVRNPRWWGHGWISVCQRPYQFSSWNADDPNRAKLLAVDGSDPAFTTALLIAARAVGAGIEPDPTMGADSYFAIGSPTPAWAAKATLTVVIGRHAFYRVELGAPATPNHNDASSLDGAGAPQPATPSDDSADTLMAAEQATLDGGSA